MATTTNAGLKIYVSSTANSTAASQNDYEALTYSEVGKVFGVGDIGEMAQIITQDIYNDANEEIALGTKRGQEVTIDYLYDPADTGQADLETIKGTSTQYAFKVELDDAGSGSPSNASAFYFRAMCAGVMSVPGAPNNFVGKRTTLKPKAGSFVNVDAV